MQAFLLSLALGAMALAPSDAEKKAADKAFRRGLALEMRGDHAEAIKAFDAALKDNPDHAEAYDHRGSEKFKLGKVAESLQDFDRCLKLRPDQGNGHWKRGISLYYVGKFDEGRKQFEGYEKVDTNDVENAVWHFLCNARAIGVEKARAAMLKIGRDKRVPMMDVYALYKGEIKPADVLAAANAGEVPDVLRKSQLFYAHLYLGIYFDVLGDRKQALEHLSLAAGKYRIGHYMGDVAAVHEQILRKVKE